MESSTRGIWFFGSWAGAWKTIRHSSKNDNMCYIPKNLKNDNTLFKNSWLGAIKPKYCVVFHQKNQVVVTSDVFVSGSWGLWRFTSWSPRVPWIGHGMAAIHLCWLMISLGLVLLVASIYIIMYNICIYKLYKCICMYIIYYTYTYIYMYVCIHVYTYIHIYICWDTLGIIIIHYGNPSSQFNARKWSCNGEFLPWSGTVGLPRIPRSVELRPMLWGWTQNTLW